MSADIVPMPGAHDSVTPANITPLPPPVVPATEDALSKLLRNPLVLAGGAMLAGMALSRLFGSPSVQKLARELADEALRRARTATPEQAPAPTLLDDAIQSVRPQITEAAKSFIAGILKKP